jgi:hypothetical protein
MSPRKATGKKPLPAPGASLERIMAFNEANGGGVVIEKRSPGYSLFREDNGRPVSRLRPCGKGDHVEIMWWSHRGR